MNEKERKEAYTKFLDAWGETAQIDMCIEEMSELIKALCKYKRFKNNLNEELIYNLKEEIADVFNTVEQMRMIFGEDEIKEISAMKIKRSLNKLENK